MFCTECGTKLDDGATLCTNCGHQIPATAAVTTMDAAPVAEPVVTPVAAPVAEPVVTPVAAPVAEPVVAPVATPVVEPTPVASQSMYSEPAAQPMYSQPASQSMYSEPAAQNGAMAGATAGTMYGATQTQGTYGAQNAYGNTQNMYGNAQNTYGAQNPSYNYNATPQQPQKKKGKGCLIAALITGGICLLGLIVIIVAIVFAVKSIGGSEDESIEVSYSDDYSDADWYTGTSDFTLPSELDSEMVSVSESESEESESVVSNNTYTVADITGAWTGTTSLVSVKGADEMQNYLEDLYGRSLTQSEIDGLSNAPATDDYAELYVYDYEDEDGAIYPGSWELDLDMGDFFGDQIWDDWDALTYDEFTYGDRSLGCITLDDNNSFYIEVMEVDYLGEYGSQFFDADDYDVQDYEVEEDGAYGIVFSGQVSEGAYGPQITGEFIVMFQYGDMAEPYGMAYEYTMDYLYEY